jgi:hypothetical protein
MKLTAKSVEYMKPLSVFWTLVAASASFASFSGCDRTPPAETFRRGIEDVQVGFVVRDPTGHSRMSGKSRVSHKLIPPTNPGDQYRAVITVDSRSLFSLQRNTPQAPEAATQEENADEGTAILEDTNPTGVEILNSDLVQKPAATEEKTTDPAESSTVSRRTNEDVHNYELAYQDGRWFLDPKTKFDQETEGSIQNAFDRALATQR